MPNELPATPVCGVDGFEGSSVFVGFTLGLLDGVGLSDADGVCSAVTVGELLTGGAVTMLDGVGLPCAVGVDGEFFTKMLMTPAASTPAIANARSL